MMETCKAKGDIDGGTPLMWAAASGNIEIITFLLDCGANVSATDKNGNSVEYYIQDDQIAELIMNHG
jgi:ankyrin repeat protein